MSKKRSRTGELVRQASGMENVAAKKADLINIGRSEVTKLLALVNKKGFSSDLTMQKQAALLYRGIHQRIMVTDAYAELHDHKDIIKCLQILSALRQEYSQIFNRLPVDINFGEGPLTVVVNKFLDDEE